MAGAVPGDVRSGRRDRNHRSAGRDVLAVDQAPSGGISSTRSSKEDAWKSIGSANTVGRSTERPPASATAVSRSTAARPATSSAAKGAAEAASPPVALPPVADFGAAARQQSYLSQPVALGSPAVVGPAVFRGDRTRADRQERSPAADESVSAVKRRIASSLALRQSVSVIWLGYLTIWLLLVLVVAGAALVVTILPRALQTCWARSAHRRMGSPDDRSAEPDQDSGNRLRSRWPCRSLVFLDLPRPDNPQRDGPRRRHAAAHTLRHRHHLAHSRLEPGPNRGRHDRSRGADLARLSDPRG